MINTPTLVRRASVAAAIIAGAVVADACARIPALAGPKASTGATAATAAPAPTTQPPPSFVHSTSDSRSSRVVDVRDGLTRAAAFRAVTDLLGQKFSVDVSDSRAGFLMTTWQSSAMRDGVPDLRYRTRVVIRFLGDDWKRAQAKVEANWQHDDEWDVGTDAPLLDEVAADLRTKIGKK